MIPRLTELSTDKLLKMQSILKRMLHTYQHNIGTNTCVLCETYAIEIPLDNNNVVERYLNIHSGGYHITQSNCDQCSWLIFEGVRCGDWFERINPMRKSPELYPSTRRRRIVMLKGWITKIDGALECRK